MSNSVGLLSRDDGACHLGVLFQILFLFFLSNIQVSLAFEWTCCIFHPDQMHSGCAEHSLLHLLGTWC